MKRLTQTAIDRMIELRERGWSYTAIAKELGVSPGAITYQCLRNGVTSPHQRGRTPWHGAASFVGKDGRTFRRFTEAEDARITQLAAEGLRCDQIAADLGRPRTSVRIRLLTLGAHEDIAAARAEAA